MKLLIAIHASHTQPEHMQAQRETWLMDLDGLADYKFFFGQPSHLIAENDPQIICTVDDAVICGCADGPIRSGNYGWHTRVSSDKTEALVAYALQNGYDYVFKCDDDTYVRVNRLLNSDFLGLDYFGFTELHHSEAVGGYYHWCQGGAGYWLSRGAMALIREHGLYMHRAEDYAVGQLLELHGIRPKHEKRYIPEVTEAELSSPEALSDAITVHKVNPHWMRKLYRRDN